MLAAFLAQSHYVELKIYEDAAPTKGGKRADKIKKRNEIDSINKSQAVVEKVEKRKYDQEIFDL